MNPKSASKHAQRRSLQFEALESRFAMAAIPFGAAGPDTAEYMLGDIYVTVVLMESTGPMQPGNQDTENWTPAMINTAKSKVTEGVSWWSQTYDNLPNVRPNQVRFHFDYTYADSPVATGYEPISNTSFVFEAWAYDFLNQTLPTTTGSIGDDLRAFNHQQRVAHGSNWAFTVFVVNDTNDPDGKFKAGGFSFGFAYPGGQATVLPLGRPVSSFAHETGHIFWGDDEYLGGDPHDSRRGYYNSQNSNGLQNAPAEFVQQPSIMASGQNLRTAFDTHTSSAATLAMIGWQDSDQDGIMDVLDVPISLEGSGRYEATTGEYRFVGKSQVRTLRNQNSAGLQNDITINRLRVVEYSIDSGAWQSIKTLDAYSADLDVRIPVAASATSVRVRTRDTITDVSSDEFTGALGSATRSNGPGIRGFLFNDADQDGVWDTSEAGLKNREVSLVDATGKPINLLLDIEPDDFAEGTALNGLPSGVLFQAQGTSVNPFVYAKTAPIAPSTGQRSFFNVDPVTGFRPEWREKSREMRVTFPTSITRVSLDAIGFDDLSYGRLEAYDSQDRLITRYTTNGLARGAKETMVVNDPSSQIAYVVASGHGLTSVMLDKLVIGTSGSIKTDALGGFTIADVPGGNWKIKANLPVNFSYTAPASTGIANVTLAAGQPSSVSFLGAHMDSVIWTNARNKLDVNDDGVVSPIDALMVVDWLNAGNTSLPTMVDPNNQPGFLDVNSDNSCSPIDALLVVDYLNGNRFRFASIIGTGGQSASLTLASSPIVSTATPVGGSPQIAAEQADAFWAVFANDEDSTLGVKRQRT